MFIKLLVGLMLVAVGAEACETKTIAGKCCDSSFEYKGNKYSKCITLGNNGHPWCYTDGGNSWGNCQTASVDCGGHRAKDCNLCPGLMGASWCNADCSWCPATSKCYTKTTDCAAEAKKENAEKEKRITRLSKGLEKLKIEVDHLVDNVKAQSKSIALIQPEIGVVRKIEGQVKQLTKMMAKMTATVKAQGKSIAAALTKRGFRYKSSGRCASISKVECKQVAVQRGLKFYPFGPDRFYPSKCYYHAGDEIIYYNDQQTPGNECDNVRLCLCLK